MGKLAPLNNLVAYKILGSLIQQKKAPCGVLFSVGGATPPSGRVLRAKVRRIRFAFATKRRACLQGHPQGAKIFATGEIPDLQKRWIYAILYLKNGRRKTPFSTIHPELDRRIDFLKGIWYNYSYKSKMLRRLYGFIRK